MAGLCFFMPGWRPLGNVGSFYQSYKRFSFYRSAFCQLTLYHRPPLPLFSLCGLCDTELTCRFGGNMMLLSCDVKVATRLPKYIHARAGMEQESRQASLTTGFSSAVGLIDQMNRSMLLHQQGQARDLKWRRSHDCAILRLLRWKSKLMKADND